MELLEKIYETQRLTIVMVSHDLTTVREHAKGVIWLHESRVLHGAVNELLTLDKIQELLDLELR